MTHILEPVTAAVTALTTGAVTLAQLASPDPLNGWAGIGTFLVFGSGVVAWLGFSPYLPR